MGRQYWGLLLITTCCHAGSNESTILHETVLSLYLLLHIFVNLRLFGLSSVVPFVKIVIPI